MPKRATNKFEEADATRSARIRQSARSFARMIPRKRVGRGSKRCCSFYWARQKCILSRGYRPLLNDSVPLTERADLWVCLWRPAWVPSSAPSLTGLFTGVINIGGHWAAIKPAGCSPSFFLNKQQQPADFKLFLRVEDPFFLTN